MFFYFQFILILLIAFAFIEKVNINFVRFEIVKIDYQKPNVVFCMGI